MYGGESGDWWGPRMRAANWRDVEVSKPLDRLFWGVRGGYATAVELIRGREYAGNCD